MKQEKTKSIKQPEKLKFIGCKECGRTDKTLIKATDSYYCVDCFNSLHKQRFVKHKKNI